MQHNLLSQFSNDSIANYECLFPHKVADIE